jgi:hypothetical protein
MNERPGHKRFQSSAESDICFISGTERGYQGWKDMIVSRFLGFPVVKKSVI